MATENIANGSSLWNIDNGSIDEGAPHRHFHQSRSPSITSYCLMHTIVTITMAKIALLEIKLDGTIVGWIL